MGNDSGIRQKNKQRTVFHKKHTVYPGMKLSPEVMIVSGSIRLKNREQTSIIKDAPIKNFKKEREDLWASYDKAAINLGKNPGSAPLQMRTSAEFLYLLASKRLIKAGQLMAPKDKYMR